MRRDSAMVDVLPARVLEIRATLGAVAPDALDCGLPTSPRDVIVDAADHVRAHPGWRAARLRRFGIGPDTDQGCDLALAPRI